MGHSGHVLPAATEMPAPATTTIFFFVRSSLSRRCSCTSSLESSSVSRCTSFPRSKYSVVRSFDFGPLGAFALNSNNLLFFDGGGPSRLRGPKTGGVFDEERLPVRDGEGYPGGGVGDLEAMDKGDDDDARDAGSDGDDPRDVRGDDEGTGSRGGGPILAGVRAISRARNGKERLLQGRHGRNHNAPVCGVSRERAEGVVGVEPEESSCRVGVAVRRGRN